MRPDVVQGVSMATCIDSRPQIWLIHKADRLLQVAAAGQESNREAVKYHSCMIIDLNEGFTSHISEGATTFQEA